MQAETDSLTYRQRVFIRQFVATGNATQAARLAGYSTPKQYGSRLLTYPNVKAEIERLTGEELVPRRMRYQAQQSAAARLMVFQARNGRIKLTYGDPESTREHLRKTLPVEVRLILSVVPKDGEKTAGQIRERFRKSDEAWFQLTPSEREELLAAVQASAKAESN